MRSTSTNNSLDAVMAQIVDSLKKFDAAIQQATSSLSNNKGGNVSTTVAALAGVQAAQVQVNMAAGIFSPGGNSATSAAFGGGGGSGALSNLPMLSGGQGGALVQGSGNAPFAGGQPSFGGSSSVGPGVFFASQVNVGFNSWHNNSNPNNPSSSSDRNRQQLRGVAIGVATSSIASGLNVFANNTAGEYDPMAGANALGRSSGAILGAIGGAILGSAGKEPAPGLGALIGTGLGADMGGAAAQAFLAPFMRTRRAEISLTSVAARQGVDASEIFGAGTSAMHFGTRTTERIRERTPGGLDEMAQDITFRGKSALQVAQIKSGIYTGTDIISGPQIAETYSTFGSALLSAGEDSRGAYDLTKRTASKYKMNAPHMAQMAAPVIGAQNQYGKNSADLLMHFGPEAYGAATDALGIPDLTAQQLAAYGGVQSAGYAAQKAGLQARGAGAAQVTALTRQANQIAVLPDGKDSLAYAQTQASIREAGRQAFDEKSVTSYDLPAMKLRNQRERQDVLPFSPGDRFSTDLKSIALNKGRIKELDAFIQQRRKDGQLSENEEYELSSQREGLVTDNYRAIADLSTGFENKLPSMSAGRPRFAQSFNSWQGAAINLHMMGSPNRSFGAGNGAQLKVQDDFVRSLGGDEDEIAPRSRTQGVNNAHNSDKLADAINRLADMIGKGNGGANMRDGQRTGEAAGQQAGQLSQKDVGQNSYHTTRN